MALRATNEKGKPESDPQEVETRNYAHKQLQTRRHSWGGDISLGKHTRNIPGEVFAHDKSGKLNIVYS